jgi:hypothetical protein
MATKVQVCVNCFAVSWTDADWLKGKHLWHHCVLLSQGVFKRKQTSGTVLQYAYAAIDPDQGYALTERQYGYPGLCGNYVAREAGHASRNLGLDLGNLPTFVNT